MLIFFQKKLDKTEEQKIKINPHYQYCQFKPSLLRIYPQGIKFNLIFILWAVYSILWKFQKKNL